jgi:sulfhydrogenase subunit gamma (sulfur reductase)
MHNPYVPYPVVVQKITVENADRDIKTFELVFRNAEDRQAFDFRCGQFAELSVLGAGESPIGIASSPMDKEFVQFSVKRMGVVTSALHNLEEGDSMGIRGPYGNGFPMEQLEGSNVVVVGGGFAFTTLRSLINYVLHPANRDRFGELTVIYGARSPGELIYKYDLDAWGKRKDIHLHVTVDAGDEAWSGLVGYVPTILKEVAPSSKDAYAVVCGPPIMIKFSLPVLKELDFAPSRIINSLEMRMKCGLGKCGRCNIGEKYVCKDGPVFTLEQLQTMPNEY